MCNRNDADLQNEIGRKAANPQQRSKSREIRNFSEEFKRMFICHKQNTRKLLRFPTETVGNKMPL